MFIILIFFYIILMNTIKNLVVAGGGAKNLAVIGLLQNINVDSVINFAGVSSGSMLVYLLSLGYTPFELEELAVELDLTQFMGEPSIENLFISKSITNLNNVKIILQTLTNYKINKDSVTFSELFQITNKSLQIGITSLKEPKFSMFNYTNTPNINVIDAILASCSIPGIFPPYKINDKYYCDGFSFNNCPMFLFKNDIKHTIGILFESNSYSNDFNILEYISFAISMPSTNITKNIMKTYPDNIIVLKKKNLPMVDFDLSKDKIIQFINHGKNPDNFINKNYFTKLFS